jgi:hypothetical protein
MGRRRSQRSIVSVESMRDNFNLRITVGIRFRHRKNVRLSLLVAERGHCVFGVIPKSLTSIENGEASLSLKTVFIEWMISLDPHTNHVHNVTYRCEHGYSYVCNAHEI